MAGRTGVMLRSRRAPVTLSCTISMLQQKVTVTQLTASSDETSWPPTVALISFSGRETVAGIAETNESRYTFPRNVAYSTSRIAGVIREVKNMPLSLK